MATAHPRQLIRAAVVAALLAGNTVAEDRVAATRIVRWRTRDLPAVAVYTLSESVDPASHLTAPRELERTVDVAIEGAVLGPDGVDDALDLLATEVERVMHADPTLGGTAGDAVLLSTEIDLFEDGAGVVGVVRLVYGVTYHTYAPDPADGGALDDLKTVDVRHDLSGAQAAAEQAHDLVGNLDA